MKRLVICCDGTWNRPDAKNVTNIEKIARTVQTDLASTGGVQQLVLYLSGVGGAGYHADRLLGGAFGLGLFHNVLAGYRFLSLNYEPGDEIYVFGFSRGAYTARSLAGMIGKVGLLTRPALVQEKLPEAVERYKGVDPAEGKKGASNAEFKRDFCHPDTPIHFVGVFDTVGALGVPGALRRRHQFHDVKLGAAVRQARQALAVDEMRMKFEPCLWDAVDESCCEDPRVKQVWFEGAHSDVGGGYQDSGLSDTALLWMVSEANEQGLAFDEELLRRYVACGESAVRHDSSKPLFKVLDLVIRTKIRLGLADGRAFDKRDRRLYRPDCVSVRIAESTAEHYRADEGYRPRNLVTLDRDTGSFARCLEPVIGLPERDYATITGRLAERGLSLGRSGVTLPGQRTAAPPVGQGDTPTTPVAG
jgi:hypothetical protein